MEKKPGKYSTELKERAVRMVAEVTSEKKSEWAAIEYVAGKLGCGAETLRKWVRSAEVRATPEGKARVDDQQRIKELEREVRRLSEANEILRKASAYFAQAEFDRRFP